MRGEHVQQFVPGIGEKEVRRFPPVSKPAEDVAIVIGKIEAALGIYVDGKQHLDNPPRPAHYVREFKSVERKARELSEELFEINYHYSDELLSLGADCSTIAAELNRLAEASRKARDQFDGQPSHGRPKNTALFEVLKQLKRIFRNHYPDSPTMRRKQGAVEALATWEKDEKKFVETALHDARIPFRNLPSLLRDSRCALPDKYDRTAVLERIERRAGRSNLPYSVPEPDPLRLAGAIEATQPHSRRSKLPSGTRARARRKKGYAP